MRSPKHQATLDALEAATTANRGRTPCRMPGAWRSFISESPDERMAAAQSCEWRPALDACKDVGRFEPFGVWGSKDRTKPETGAVKAAIAS